MKITLVANSSWYVLNFRSNLIKELKEKGHEVSVIAPSDDYSNKLQNLKIDFFEWKLHSSSTNLFKELISIINLRFAIKKINSDVILSFTPKGNIYSGICNFSMRKQIKFIPNISGLGVIKQKNYFFKSLIFFLYKFALSSSVKVFFQNNDDMNFFVSNAVVQNDKSIRIPGSGVDTPYFKQDKYKPSNTFLFVGRLIFQKGLIEFIEAAKKVKSVFPTAKFKVIGAPSNSKSIGVTQDLLQDFFSTDDVEYLGVNDEMKKIYSTVGAVVLPSYYGEGVPRALLEASSMMIPIITTNHAGCIETIEDRVTGFVCEPKNIDSLARQIKKFIDLSDDQKIIMGKRGRDKMKSEFSEDFVISTYLAFI